MEEHGQSNMNDFTRKFVQASLILHTLIALFIIIRAFTPYNNWFTPDIADSLFLLSAVLMCISVFSLLITFYYFFIRYEKELWSAGLPLAIGLFFWFLYLIGMPAIEKTLDLRFRFFHDDLQQSANEILEARNMGPNRFRNLSPFINEIEIVRAGVFFQYDSGNEGFHQRGYLYSPSDNFHSICEEASKILFAQHWYDCMLSMPIFSPLE